MHYSHALHYFGWPRVSAERDWRITRKSASHQLLPKRSNPGGWVYQVLNRANARMPIFTKDEDFAAFERVLEEAVARTGTRLLSYCVMGNH